VARCAAASSASGAGQFARLRVRYAALVLRQHLHGHWSADADVPPRDLPRLLRIGLDHDGLLREQQRSLAEDASCASRVLRGDEVGLRTVRPSSWRLAV
jgi:hypothetical protein